MRQEYVDCSCRKTAYRRCPWAAICMKVEGGFRCFESVTDYQTARRQT